MGYVAFQYAEALFSLAYEEKKTQNVIDAYKAFLDAQDDEVYKFLNHPKVSKHNKKDVIAKAITDSLFKNFVNVLIDNSRIDLLEDCFNELTKIVNNQNKIMDVTVYSMKPLLKTELDKLVENLEKKHNRTIKLENIVDQKIVGGLRIEYEGHVLDDTINNFLGSLKANLTR